MSHTIDLIILLSGPEIRQKARRSREVWWLGVVLTMAVALCLMIPSPAIAEDDPAGNFQFSYEPVSFDKSEINGSEVFHATITGRVTCIKDLTISASEASLISRVVAVNTATGTEVTLNSSYTVAIKPFPSKKDETAEINQAVPLQFPAKASSGDYNVVGRIVEAKVKVVLAWVDVSGYLPQQQSMGTVKYVALESTGSPSPQAGPDNSPLELTQPVPERPTTPEPSMPWWTEVIVIAALATTVFNIIWFWRHRTR